MKSRSDILLEVNARKVALELEINVLKSEREKEERLTREAQETLAGVVKNRDELELDIDTLFGSMDELSSLIGVMVKDRLELLKESGVVVTQFMSTLKGIEVAIVKKLEEVEKVRKLRDDYHSEILRDGEAAAKQKADLDIYMRRIEKLRDEIAPEMKIILT